ncbi:hypothetical protein [Pseudoalteromonas peptidolytica]|uniref:HEAT repeat domain-containing protein n=1 Tax=Pseudoalteromonas peptidolytica F12-50-A1 TaxID=1315280 RepID=A0A8I0T5Z0_9GAMM|nr:hypothetical protein [Pseudoalteromonas peptidolytica]MBE0349006.1 hypothetical protein [Pseudoalteromonas peptidolytica F12-50-A1]NLR15838.1 hypothetical protein [Pseudoalteromonas peptidolytica]GEK09485.1 hypothetical protein PPE03_17340 [Pseudoalteromonas peptidolytica]
MSNLKLNIALSCSVLALAFSGFNVIQTKLATSPVATQVYPAPAYQSTEQATQYHVFANTANEQTQDIAALLTRIDKLESRIQALSMEKSEMLSEQAPQEFESLVFSLIEKREQQKIAEMKAENPIYGFYEDLPEDYEMRIKTDPEYAGQVSNELKQKILNSSLPAAERLAAMSQLQMNMFMLNRNDLEQYDYQAVESILNMTHSMSDEKLRLQALELVSRTPIVDERLSQSFVKMLEQEQNDYVKSLAAEGLMSQYFQSGSDPKQQKKIAQDLLSLYENAADPKVKAILKNLMGDERMLEELKSQSNG